MESKAHAKLAPVLLSVGAVLVASGLVTSASRGSLRADSRSTVPGAEVGAAGAVVSARPAPVPLHKYAVGTHVLPPAEDLAPGALRVLLLGDSLAQFLGVTMRHVQDDSRGFVAERGLGSCNVFAPKVTIENDVYHESSSCSEDWPSDVAQLRPDVTVIVMGGAFFSAHMCEREFRAAYMNRLDELRLAMGPRAGRLVVAVVPYPIGSWRYDDIPTRVECLDEVLRGFASKNALATLDLMSLVCPTKECRTTEDGAPIRPDGLHFDGPGAYGTARYVWNELFRLAGK